jgi:hypothetical protein
MSQFPGLWRQGTSTPACNILTPASNIWWPMKGPVFNWRWYRLCQTGKGCVGMWPWPSGPMMESVLQESPPHHGLAMVNLSGQSSLSLSLIKDGFSFGDLRKSSEPITVRQAIWENSDASQGLILDCQCYVDEAELECTEAFFSSP